MEDKTLKAGLTRAASPHPQAPAPVPVPVEAVEKELGRIQPLLDKYDGEERFVTECEKVIGDTNDPASKAEWIAVKEAAVANMDKIRTTIREILGAQ